MDAATAEALGQEVVYIRWYAWMDIAGDPLRAVSGVGDRTFGAGETGDPDLDGKTFFALNSNLVDVSDVGHSEGGAETVTATLSGLIVQDDELLSVIGDRANWVGREARLWFQVVTQLGVPIGGMVPYYTGYMSAMRLRAAPDSQTVTCSIESYLASFSEASGKTYLMQREFDPGDNSADRTLAAANGLGGSSPAVRANSGIAVRPGTVAIDTLGGGRNRPHAY